MGEIGKCELGKLNQKFIQHVFEIFPPKNDTSEMLKIGKIGPQTDQMAQIQPKYAYSFVIWCNIYNFLRKIM